MNAPALNRIGAGFLHVQDLAGATLAFMKAKGVEICFEERRNVLMVMQEH